MAESVINTQIKIIEYTNETLSSDGEISISSDSGWIPVGGKITAGDTASKATVGFRNASSDRNYYYAIFFYFENGSIKPLSSKTISFKIIWIRA